MSIAYKIETDKVITVTSHTGGTGPKGDAATIQVGSVVSGQTASVANVGTETAAVFDFVLPKGDKGDPGRDGTNGQDGRDGRDGQDGTAATIQVGRTETVTPGTPASVINEGTETAARLVFHIPQGVQGEQGATGATGPAGRDGQDGAPGQDGAAAGFGTPTASATGLSAGSNPTITITASGSDTSKVFDFAFGIPAGQTGPAGQDYVLTAQDKTDIATEVYGMLNNLAQGAY